MPAHTIEPINNGVRCTVCMLTWRRKPVSSCAGIRVYSYWDHVPPHLKTKTQLGKMGLKPTGAVRAIVDYEAAANGPYDLYDLSEVKPKRQATAAQLAALAKAREAADVKRRTCPSCQQVQNYVLIPGDICGGCASAEDDAELAEVEAMWRTVRDKAIRWARRILQREDWVIFDCETTGLESDSEIVQIGVLSSASYVLLDTLVRPLGSMGATEIHGITAEMVVDAPLLEQLVGQLEVALHGKTVVTYNASFDAGRLRSGLAKVFGAPYEHLGWDGVQLTQAAVGTWMKNLRWICAMEKYAAYVGEWSETWGDWKFQPLPGGDHSAIGDCRATLSLIHRMAATPLSTEEEVEQMPVPSAETAA